MTERDEQAAILWHAVRYNALLPIVQDPLKTLQILCTLKAIEKHEEERRRTRGRGRSPKTAERLARLLPTHMSAPEGGRWAAISEVLGKDAKPKAVDAAMELCREELERLTGFKVGWPAWIAEQQENLTDALDAQNSLDALVKRRRRTRRRQEKPA